MRRRLAAGLIALVVLVPALSCSRSEAVSQIVVAVGSDLSLPAELDTLEVRVVAPGKVVNEQVPQLSFALAATPALRQYNLPLSFSLTPADNHSKQRVLIVLTGLHAGVPVVEQQVTTAFVPEESLVLDVFLSRRCLDVLCRDQAGQRTSSVCDVRSGVCAEVPSRDQLPAWAGTRSELNGIHTEPADNDASISIPVNGNDAGLSATAGAAMPGAGGGTMGGGGATPGGSGMSFDGGAGTSSMSRDAGSTVVDSGWRDGGFAGVGGVHGTSDSGSTFPGGLLGGASGGGSLAGFGGSASGVGGAGGTFAGLGTPDAGSASTPFPASVRKPDASKLPQAKGTCPSLITGAISINGSAAQLTVGPKAGPMVFYWHGTGSSASEVEQGLPGASTEIRDNGGVLASFSTSNGQGDNTGDLTWYTGDIESAEQLLACAIQQNLVDTGRIHVVGYSTGGMQAGTMLFSRSKYLASVLIYSGGPMLNGAMAGSTTFGDPSNVPATLGAHGAKGSDWLINDFHDGTLAAEDAVKAAGGFAIDCDDNGSHTDFLAKRAGVGGQAWKFLKDHPYAEKPDPYASGLPTGYPTYCKIH